MINDPAHYRILMIEDNSGDCLIVEDFLSVHMSNASIIRAKSFKEACEVLTGSADAMRFDIILLDLSLPDKHGKELVAAILVLAPECPVIILTGYADIHFGRLSLSQGVVDYLIKEDLNAIVLYKSIVYAIERKKTTARLEESEKRYSDLFHLNPVPMWVYDPETLFFLDFNTAAIEQYGYDRQEFASMTVGEIHPEHGEAEQADCNSSTRKVSSLGTPMHKVKSGELIHVAVHSNSIIFKGKRAILMLANNISDRMKYIAAIEEQNEAFRQIAQIQSHVVRAPLAKMMGIVELIKNLNIPSQEAMVLLNHFTGAGLELDTIIRDISKKSEHANVNIN